MSDDYGQFTILDNYTHDYVKPTQQYIPIYLHDHEYYFDDSCYNFSKKDLQKDESFSTIYSDDFTYKHYITNYAIAGIIIVIVYSFRLIFIL